MLLEDQVSKDLLNAAMGAGSWQTAIDGIATLTRSSRAQLLGVFDNNEIFMRYITQIDEKALSDFKSINGFSPRINPRWAKIANSGELIITSDHELDEIRGEMINHDHIDYAMDWDVPYGAQTNLLKAKGRTIVLNSIRTRKEGKSDEGSLNAFTRIAPKVRDAVILAENLENQGTLLLTGALEAMTIGAFILDKSGIIVGQTQSSYSHLSANGIFRVQNNRLTPILGIHQLLFNNAISQLLLTGAAQSIAFPVSKINPEPVFIDVFALPKNSWNFSKVPRIVVKIRRKEIKLNAQIIRELYGFSTAEAQIALDFAKGLSRHEIAKRRGVSIDTIRVQLKSIYEKANVNRETELIAKIILNN